MKRLYSFNDKNYNTEKIKNERRLDQIKRLTFFLYLVENMHP